MIYNLITLFPPFSAINSQMHHVHDIARLILRIKKVEASFHEWCKLHSSLSAALRIVQLLLAFISGPDTHTEDVQYIREMFMVDSMTASILSIAYSI